MKRLPLPSTAIPTEPKPATPARVVTAAVAYVLDGYVTKVLPLPKDPESEP